MNAGSDRMRHLQQMAGLVLDTRTQELRRANAARDALLRQLADLEAAAPAADLPWIAAEQARFGYEIWADARRAEINLRLATQRAICLQAADAARLAFGRKMALERVQGHLPRQAGGRDSDLPPFCDDGDPV